MDETAGLQQRNHQCLFYRTEEEHRESVIFSLIQGFEQKKKIIYICDAHTSDTILGYLEPYKDTGIKSAIEHRQLRFYFSEETYLKNSIFNPDIMFELIETETERACSEGYAGLLGISEMTWASKGAPGTGKLVDYEVKLNEFLIAKRYSTICQYDMNRFDDKLLLTMLITHPTAMLGTEVYDNQYFIPPSKFFKESISSFILAKRLNHLRELKNLLNCPDKQDQAEKALLENEEKYRTLFEESRDAIYITTKNGQLLDANQAFLDLFGYSGEDISNLNVKDAYVNQEDEKSFKEIAQKTGSLKDFELKLKKRDGTIIDCLFTLAVKKGADNRITGYQGIVRDITGKKRAEETIKEMAYHDALTGLPNRRLFFDRLTMAISHAERNQERLAIMMLDLDRFKDVNDTFGHITGDVLLKAVAERLISILRKGDTIARMGGDEFLLILPEVDKTEDSDIIARKIIEIFQEAYVLDERQISITTSIGISIYPDNGTDVDTLLRNADIAMYDAKKAGRNNYQYAGS